MTEALLRASKSQNRVIVDDELMVVMMAGFTAVATQKFLSLS